MTTTITVRHGELEMPMPDRTGVGCGNNKGTWTLRLGNVYVLSEIDGLAYLHSTVTRAMTRDNYADELNIDLLIEHVRSGIAAITAAGRASEIDGTVRELLIAGGDDA